MLIETYAQSREVRHVEGATFRCGDCGEVKPVGAGGGTGYGWKATTPDAKPICYACCSKAEAAHMIEHGRATLYFTPTKGASYNRCEVTDWPGGLRFVGAYSVGRHNMAGRRYDVRFTGPDSTQWHGVTYGGNTQICHCKRLKAQPLAQLSALPSDA